MIKQFVFICSLSFLIFSCKFNEDIYLKSDGKMDYKMTMSMSMPFGKLAEEFVKLDSTDTTASSELDNPTKKEVDKSKNFDTIMYFSDIVKKIKADDSYKSKKLTKEEREALKHMNYLDPFSLRMKMSGEDMLVEFEGKNLVDTALNFASKAMQSKALKSSVDQKNMLSGDKNSSMMGKKSVIWDGNTFIYKGELIAKKPTQTKSSKKLDASDLDKMMMQGAFIRTFRFEKPIKSINVKTAEISEDKKSVKITYDMAEYESKLKANDIKVELE